MNYRTTLSAGTMLAGLFAMACSAGPGTLAESTYIDDAPPIGAPEYVSRRTRILSRIADGILLLQARPAEKAMEQWGFLQDPGFLYYTGLSETPAAILALDGVRGTSHIFLPPPPESFGMAVTGVIPEPGEETATRLGVDTALPWTEFEPWVSARLEDGVTRLYLDDSRRPEATGVPNGMNPVAGPRTLWRTAIEAAFPGARIESAKTVIMEQRAIKSEAEVGLLGRNALRTAASLRAVASRLEPGTRQRDTEAAMIATCLATGGEGPSFWPWTMSGPNAHVGELVGAFFRYDQGDRIANAGELVRVDIGCAGGLYGADVGRTLPVSGRFTEGQAEAWDLLIAGYFAGLDAMAAGVTVSEVRAASIAAVGTGSADLSTQEGRDASEEILSGGESVWHIHGVGIDSGEDIPGVLGAGMVVAYEPGFSLGPDAYYLEDMILITERGHRVLSTGLPYSAAEIAEAMGRR